MNQSTTVSACCGTSLKEGSHSGDVCSKCDKWTTPTSPTETVSDLEHKILAKIGQCKQPIGYSCEYCSALHDVLSMLKQPSEHDLELIREGHQRSDRDTRRGV